MSFPRNYYRILLGDGGTLIFVVSYVFVEKETFLNACFSCVLWETSYSESVGRLEAQEILMLR